MPRAVLASRLKTLVAADVMTRVAGERHLEYELTDKGTALWPVVLSLISWGDDFCARPAAAAAPARCRRRAGRPVGRVRCLRQAGARGGHHHRPRSRARAAGGRRQLGNRRADQPAPAAAAPARGRRSRGSLTGQGLPDAPPPPGEANGPPARSSTRTHRSALTATSQTRTLSRAQFGEPTQDQSNRRPRSPAPGHRARSASRRERWGARWGAIIGRYQAMSSGLKRSIPEI